MLDREARVSINYKMGLPKSTIDKQEKKKYHKSHNHPQVTNLLPALYRLPGTGITSGVVTINQHSKRYA
jgi:hypothetical protein